MYDGRNQGTAQPRSQRAEGTQCVLGALHVLLLLLLLVWVGSCLDAAAGLGYESRKCVNNGA